ncbi:HK97 family phage prohead protease [Clostridium pasteurianum]|uniref:Caudovirus prohead protease n=1 Tax=Clostridium pasteurianum BC1 TaxID=86416 RepID=R4K510_CLOPA|nr:HK97 family phage prohead protease [Clostridium pasteurianum]AGK96796.1 Caudovirus prohead protease [Clostridium pasteurianum BC1]
MSKQNKQFVLETKVLDEANRIIQMTGSTEDYDRVGDKIIMSGVDLTNYLKNPIILANHNYGSDEKSTCIGKALDVQVIGSQLVFKIQFADTPNGQEWFYLYKNKFMNASSVGFIPLESEPNSQGGYTYKKIELLELSMVAIPCNPECVQRAFTDGKISKALFDAINKNKNNGSEVIENMKVEEVKELITNAVKSEVKTLEDKHNEELGDKVKEIDSLNAKIKDLEALVQGKSGAKLSQSTCDCLTKACKGITDHVESIKSLIDVVNTQETDGDNDGGDTKEYTQEEINKAVQENINKILGGK